MTTTAMISSGGGLMDGYETLVQRARILLDYMGPGEVQGRLVETEVDPTEAYFAVKGALVLNRMKGATMR